MSQSIRRAVGPKAVAVVGVVIVAFASIALLSDGNGGDGNGEAPVAGKRQAETSAAARSAGVRGEPAERPRQSTQRLYWGAWIGSQLTGTEAPFDMRAVSRFERIAGKRVSVVHFAAPFANCQSHPCSFYPFPSREMTKVRRHGAIPMYSWSSAQIPGETKQRAFQLRDLIAGRYDRFIRRFARAVKRWGHPFFLRFDWEMNGDWFPWAVRANANRPSDFVPAWRHVHRIFSAVGTTNAAWVWCPYADPTGKDNLRRLYPGDSYVDWTCIDGYNWGPGNPANSRPWVSFDALFRSTYRRIVSKVAPRKPIIIGEIASSDYGGSKRAWVRDALRKLANRYPKIRGVVWFNKDDRGAGWPIENSRPVIGAFRRGIGSRAFAPDLYRRIKSSPIRPTILR